MNSLFNLNVLNDVSGLFDRDIVHHHLLLVYHRSDSASDLHTALLNTGSYSGLRGPGVKV
jgi:hypothetical protein